MCKGNDEQLEEDVFNLVGATHSFDSLEVAFRGLSNLKRALADSDALGRDEIREAECCMEQAYDLFVEQMKKANTAVGEAACKLLAHFKDR
jgi:hypothetical protein